MKYKAILATLALLGGSIFLAGAQNVVKDSLGFDKAMAVTPATLIQGQVSGVRVSPIDGNVNGAVSTLIRGVNALRSDSQPLWIVDGVMINASLSRNNDAFFQFGEKSYTSPLNALAYINPYDIESIEVLKDLSATTIYGSQGAHGVIIVNTRIPSQERFLIEWRSNLGFSEADRELDGASTGWSHNHYLNMSGATGQTRYAISAFYRDTQGIFKANNGVFGGMRANFDTKANSVVWFGLSTAIALGSENSIAGTSYFGQPSLTMTMRDPSFFPGDTPEGWAADYDDNAVERRVTSNMYLTLNFTPALSLKTSFGIDFHNNNRYIWYGNGTSFGKENNGAASLLATSFFKYNAKSELTWNRYFGHDHHLVAKAAIEAIGEWTKFNTINGTDFFSHVLRARGVSLKASKAVLHKFDHNYNTLGTFASINYSFKDVAGIDAVLRADNTPKYDDAHFILYKGAQGWFNLRSVLFADNEVISSLKLSAGYGEAGQERYVPYGMYGNYISGTYPSVPIGEQPFHEALNRLRSMETNVGIDLGVLNDKVKVHAGYYDKMTNDKFVAYTFGVKDKRNYWVYGERSDVFEQHSIIANRGFEGDVDICLVDKSNFKWTVRANGAYNVNQMLYVDPADCNGRAVGDGVFVNANVVGKPVGALYGYEANGAGSVLPYIDKTKDGRIDEFDKDVIGNPNPKVYGGIGTTIRSGIFTLDVLANGAAGFDILNLNDLLLNEAAPYNISDAYVEKGDYLRLSRVSVGFDIPVKKAKWIQELNISLTALNLLTRTSYSGWNPEVNCFGTSYLSSGVDYGAYPTAKSIVGGVCVKF